MSKNIVESFLSKSVINKYHIRITISDAIVIGIIIITSIIFSQLLIHKHEVYSSYAWDLGIFAQALKTTLDGKFMYHTPQLYLLPNGNHMFIHFTPILLLLLPIYALAPYATTLLVIKSFITFAAAYPLYLIGKRLNRESITSIIIAIIFIFYPLLHGALWFDFQFSIFFPLLIFLTEYTFLAGKKIPYFISITLLALVSEQGALYALLMIIVHTVMYVFSNMNRIKPYIMWLFSTNKNDFLNLRYMLIIVGLASAYYLSIINFLDYAVNEHVTEEFREHLKAYAAFSISGYKGNTILLPLYAITHPNETFNAITFDYHIKFIFVILAYGILAFLPLQSIYGLISTFFVTTFIISNYKAYYAMGAHYPYYYLGFIFLGFIITISKISNIKNRFRILISILFATILLVISFAPWSTMSTLLIDGGLVWYPIVPSEKDLRMRSLDELTSTANRENESLLVQNHVFTHTTMNDNVYVLPPYDLYSSNRPYFDLYINNTLIPRSNLILLDLKFDPLATDILQKYSNEYGIYAEGYNAVLLKRDYNREPIIDQSSGECLDMRFHDNAYSDNNIVRLEKQEGFFVYGPYKFMFQGSYTVTYELKATDIDTYGAVAVLDISNELGRNVFARQVISGYELRDNEWHTITLPFSIRELYANDMEFRVYSLGNSNLEFKGCNIERIDRKAMEGSGNVGILAEELSFNVGFKEDKAVTLLKGIRTDTFWYGPNIRMVDGVYVAEIYLKIEPKPIGRVIDIIIMDDGKIATYKINKDSLIKLEEDWYIARIPFVLDKAANNLEIIGKNPNPNYKITISHINIESI